MPVVFFHKRMVHKIHKCDYKITLHLVNGPIYKKKSFLNFTNIFMYIYTYLLWNTALNQIQ